VAAESLAGLNRDMFNSSSDCGHLPHTLAIRLIAYNFIDIVCFKSYLKIPMNFATSDF